MGYPLSRREFFLAGCGLMAAACQKKDTPIQPTQLPNWDRELTKANGVVIRARGVGSPAGFIEAAFPQSELFKPYPSSSDATLDLVPYSPSTFVTSVITHRIAADSWVYAVTLTKSGYGSSILQNQFIALEQLEANYSMIFSATTVNNRLGILLIPTYRLVTDL